MKLLLILLLFSCGKATTLQQSKVTNESSTKIMTSKDTLGIALHGTAKYYKIDCVASRFHMYVGDFDFFYPNGLFHYPQLCDRLVNMKQDNPIAWRIL